MTKEEMISNQQRALKKVRERARRRIKRGIPVMPKPKTKEE